MIQSPVAGEPPARITSSMVGKSATEEEPPVAKESPVEKTSLAETEPPVDRRSLNGQESPAVKEFPARHDTPIEEESPAVKDAPVERVSLVKDETLVEKDSPAQQESSAERESPVKEKSPIEKDTLEQQAAPAERESLVREEAPVEKDSPAEKDSLVKEEPVVETQPSVQQESPVQKQSPIEGESSAEKDESALPGHESMVTVRLSEPPSLVVDTDLPPAMPTRRSMFGPEYTPTPTPTSAKPSSLRSEDRIDEVDEEDEDLMQGNTVAAATGVATQGEGDEEAIPGRSTLRETVVGRHNLQQELEDASYDEESKGPGPSSSRRGSVGSDSEDEVNWDALQKKEDEQAQDQQDDNSTAMLLARLEEENNKLAVNPKGVKVKVVEQPTMRRPRPPSMAQMKQMVNGPTPGALRYSVLPPPPMTELEFYMALVKDYQQTAARLPTLLSKKIRKGIPPPLRGVVWQSMAGARDSGLLEQFDRLSGESSPYEGLIGKDLGRSFPGVDMFRDPEGDGQRMLGRVLKCFSLYDQKIGYCQGLAFLVGPLLMHMPDSQAFCVLVRLMDQYDLRSCFLPDLSGLHVRIYQFRELLRANLPNLSAHLDELQVDPAYVSQWFLSFFAVTCPLPMLFRIYDVIFAEGASETIMRVALSLMQKNESRILACSELEDVMQLLLSRGLWDCYHYNADEFVDDFVSLSGVVSREKLAQLELNYREAQIATTNAPRSSDVTTAASRFLGRLWTTSSSSPKSALGALSPSLIAPSRPLSMLRRSTSKQSLASTLNSMDASSASVLSTASTDATTISRDSSSNADDASIRESTPTAPKQSARSHHQSSNATENKALHTQIEDLLTAFSELQRNHALLATDLQREREQREEERQAVKLLLDGLKKTKKHPNNTTPSDASAETQDDGAGQDNGAEQDDGAGQDGASDELSKLIDGVEERFGASAESTHATSVSETRAQLRDELARVKEHLMIEVSKSQELNRRIDDLGQEAQNLKDQLRDSHTHARSLHQDKQRLEKQVHTMRVHRASSDTQAAGGGGTGGAEAGGWFASAANSAANLAAGVAGGSGPPNGGLRELKLGRSKSTPSQANYVKRSSSLLVRTQTEPVGSPSGEHESLVLELVQAKTAEAVARQEADEYKQALESLRKACGIAPGGEASAATGLFGRLTGAVSEAGNANKSAPPAAPALTSAPAPAANANGGGFWGWRR